MRVSQEGCEMFSMRKKDGYTLMELLTVIAIIAVLAGLIFPVAASAKKRARQAQCMNNMYQIFTALKQFQLDEHRYPDFIAGPVQFKSTTPPIEYTGSEIIPLENNTGMMGGSTGGNGRLVALFPEYIPSLSSLRCPFTDLNGDNNRKYTNGDPTATPGTPESDVDPDPMCAVLKVLNITDALRAKGVDGSGSTPYWIYDCSTYDYQKPPGYLPTDTGEIHYSTVWASGNDPATDPGITRQLKWRTPPEDTVVTWCSHHRSNDSTGTPLGSSKDICLYLDGHVKQVPSQDMRPWTNGWRVAP